MTSEERKHQVANSMQTCRRALQLLRGVRWCDGRECSTHEAVPAEGPAAVGEYCGDVGEYLHPHHKPWEQDHRKEFNADLTVNSHETDTEAFLYAADASCQLEQGRQNATAHLTLFQFPSRHRCICPRGTVVGRMLEDADSPKAEERSRPPCRQMSLSGEKRE